MFAFLDRRPLLCAALAGALTYAALSLIGFGYIATGVAIAPLSYPLLGGAIVLIVGVALLVARKTKFAEPLALVLCTTGGYFAAGLCMLLVVGVWTYAPTNLPS